MAFQDHHDIADTAQESAENTTQPKTEAKTQSFLTLFVVGLLVSLAVVVIGLYIAARAGVRQVSQTPFTLKTASAFNLPVASINGVKVSYVDYIDDVNTLKAFFAKAPEGYPIPDDTQISDQALSRLLINRLVERMAKKQGLSVSEEDIVAARAELLSTFPDEETAAAELQNSYGWSMETFTERVARPVAYEKKVREAFENNTITLEDAPSTEQVRASHILFMVSDEEEKEAVKQKAEEVLKRIQDGESFEELAKEFGSDGTKEQGGDLGWFGRGVMVPPFEEAVFALEPGQLSDRLIETQFGYHIVKVVDKRSSVDFNAYMTQLISTANVRVYADIHNPFEIPTADVVVPEGESPPLSDETVLEGTSTDEQGPQE